MATAKNRFKKAWKALSVQALALVAAAPAILPHIAPHVNLDPKHFGIVTSAVAIGGILGWIKPQPKLDRELSND